MVEIAKAVSYESDVLIMDEPTSALTEKEVAHLFAIIRDLRAQGKGIVYITHKMNELFEIADEFSVFRDGKYIGTARRDGCDARRHHPHDGRPRDHPDVPQGGGADRRRGAVGREPQPRRRVPRRLVRPARRARSSALPGWSARAARNVAEAIFGVTPATSGADRDPRQAGRRSTRPRTAMRHGMAFLTEDRKDTGCFLILDVLENMQMAVLQTSPTSRAASSTRASVDRICEDMRNALRVKTPDLHERIDEPVRRQPAEGADRPLAADQAPDPDPRRADPRHRRRRQGRDPPADHASSPATAWPSS